MAITINVNKLTLCHRGSDGVSHNTIPDVCKTPEKALPLPYDNEAYSRDLIKGSTSVFADGGNMVAKLGSQFARSIYDERGIMGGIVSGTVMAEAEWITHSFDVFIEKKAACRLTDKMFMNHRNTVNLAGLKQRDLPEADQEFFDELCEMACECLSLKGSLRPGQTFQDCVKDKVDERYYDNGYPRGDANMWREIPFDRGNNWNLIGSRGNPNVPTSNFIRPNSRRLDIARTDGQGNITRLFDMKFGNDTLTPEAQRDYQRIARRQTGSADNFEEFRVEDRCDCEDPPPPEPVPVPVPVPAPAPAREKSLLDQFGEALTSTTGIKVTGTALVLIFVISEASRLFPPRNLVPIP